MCGSPKKLFKKVFGGGQEIVKQAPPPAAAVAAPTETVSNGLESERTQRQTRAKGKRKLTIPTKKGSGTGVNI
jgi:hypothetical protein